MGFFGNREEKGVQAAMDSVGARKGSHSENCERCDHYASSRETGSKSYGGCRLHNIKVFSNHVCNRYQR